MPVILHCDANNFYASVEIMLDPKLKNAPLAVTGNPEKRHGIILAKDNTAKKYGVKTGDTLREAALKCPNIVFVRPQYDKYVYYSNKIFEIYTQFTDKVEPFGIDECWLDVTGSAKLFGDGKKIADSLRERIKNEIGITVSVGVSFTKIFAKLGSDMKKPDATTLITPDNYKSTVWHLPASDLLMIGRKTAEKLKKVNILTIGDVARANPDYLRSMLGIVGERLHDYANGKEGDEVREYYNNVPPESIGNSITMPRDITTESEAAAVIYALADKVATRLRRHKLRAKGVSFYVKFNDLTGIGKQLACPSSINSASALSRYSTEILNDIYRFGIDKPIRAMGVSSHKLCSVFDSEQLNIFSEDYSVKETVEYTVGRLREKYGYSVLRPAIVMLYPDLCGDIVDSDFQPFKK